jgi:hypothetical protein
MKRNGVELRVAHHERVAGQRQMTNGMRHVLLDWTDKRRRCITRVGATERRTMITESESGCVRDWSTTHRLDDHQSTDALRQV